ncbi:type I polyketide synthase [Streptomyces sp. NRRL F-5123]|uniref:type I polyketide synthase n=1 Tax=Streptomyces sp. NRRL F-5123 TaxID=1463856 RepID=UPI0004E27FC4|nr:type I polyketide synthase [Streptomyces sp. NRRL F-5123]
MADDQQKLLDYLKRVTGDLRDARRRIEDAEHAAHEPVAVVGIGCRFPGGVSSADDLWELVAAGRDATGDLPADRGWDLDALYDPEPGHAGTSYVRRGGFVTGADRFDAAFFGISPNEAVTMAPQQRLALEVAWEAIEHARIDPHTLRGSRTGTYLGCDGIDYFLNSFHVPDNAAGYLTTGNSPSVVAGRVAYALGLEGAAVTLDTACSSALVAMHLACQALRQREVGLALAGGVYVMSSTAPLVGFSELRALAPDGRCKPFAAGADGMTLAEGAGIVLLERLSDARSNGHPVLAVIRGSAVNEDGASNGLTAPNGPSQQRVIEQALANARLAPADVDAVEAHGTGTALGDPIEAQALLAAYGRDRPEGRPLWLGSVKANIGHTQIAAGAAGVVKTVMALRHGTLPRLLHLDEPSPHVAWGSGDVRLLTSDVPWPRDGQRPRRAGVSAFGFSGTNAHLILEEAPETPRPATAPPSAPAAVVPSPGAGAAAAPSGPGSAVTSSGPDVAVVPSSGVEAAVVPSPGAGAAAAPSGPGSAVTPSGPDVAVVPSSGSDVAVARAPGPDVAVWALSARSADALRGQARRLLAGVRDTDPHAVGWSLAATRSAFEHRAAVTGSGTAELRERLAALAAGEPAPGVVTGTARTAGPGVVLVFPGQGSQWPGMGRELLDSSAVFAARIAECEAALAPYVDWSLTGALRGAAGAPDPARVDVVQPVLWALMVALAAEWAHHGVVPAAVVGHSQGEIAAACVAGALALDEGARVVAQRSQALRALAGKGAMASLGIGSDAAVRLVADLGEAAAGVGVAALNSPSSTVVSGPPDAVAAAVAACEATGARARTIDVDYASHGPQVDAIADDVRARLAGVQGVSTDVAFHSTLTGGPLDTAELDAGYWLANLRRPVRLTEAVDSLLAAGHRVFVEVSTHPVLVPVLQQCFEAAGIDAHAAGTLRRGEGGPAQLALALGQAFAAGAPVDFRAWHGGPSAARAVDLPTYAFDRQRYWLPTARPGAAGGPQDPAEAELWGAVEEEDAVALAGVLEPDGDPAAGAEALRPALPMLAAWRSRHRERGTLAAWGHRIRWTPLPEPAPPALAGTWLLLAPDGRTDDPAVRTAAEALRAHGAAVRQLTVDARTAQRAGLAAELAAADEDFAGVVSLLALDERPRPGRPGVPAGLSATVAALQALGDSRIGAPLWCVTRGAVSTGPADPLPHPVQAQVWGLGRVAALEHPDRWGGLADLPAEPGADAAARLAAVLAGIPRGEGAEDQTAVRTEGVLARRLDHAAPERGPGRPWQPAGTVLVTGGTGGVGALLARWAARSGAARLVLTSRRGPDAPGARELAEELRGLGAEVTIAACDAADREAMAGVLAAIPAGQPLTAVVHAAGVSDQALIADADDAHLERMLAPKALAARHLHELTRHLELSAFVLFSSVSAVWGSGGQAAYAAANAQLDALAEHRRGLGLPATSVAWGLWGEVGMATSDEEVDFFRRRGIRPLEPGLALAALREAVGRPAPASVVAAVDWRRFLPSFTALRPSALLADLPEAAADRAEEAGPAPQEAGPLLRKLTGRPAAEQHEILLRHVQGHAAGILGHSGADAVPPGKPFQELGFDSLTAVQLRNELSGSTGLRLPTTVLFDHPTADDLARHLHGLLVADAATGEQHVMAGLDGWDAAHAPDAVGEAARNRVAVRLRLLADKWAGEGGEADAHGDLEEATAQEIFDLIATEFGKS